MASHATDVHNSFGHLFRVTTWGESHGPAIGCVVDGCPPRIPLSEADIQPWLDRRRPGQSRFTTQRQEPDQVRILSGVFEGLTTGTPIALQIDNVDQRSRDYGEIAAQFRPGHADLTYELKYGIRDYRGGGRSLGAGDRDAGRRRRRGAQGAGRRRAHPRRAGADRPAPHRPGALGLGRGGRTTRSSAPTRSRRQRGRAYLAEVRKAGSSVGAVIEVVAEGVPPGLGAPIYGKLDADIAAALMSINAVKGVEIGDGLRRRRADAARPTPTRCACSDGVGAVRLQPCRRHPRRHLHRPADRGALRGEADQLDPDAAPLRGPPGQDIEIAHEGPARSLRRHPRRAGGRGDAGLRAGRPSAAPPGAEPGRAGATDAPPELAGNARSAIARSGNFQFAS